MDSGFTHESQVKEQRHRSLIKQTTIFELKAASQTGVPKLWKQTEITVLGSHVAMAHQ